jgi:hypothetical protein
MESVQIIKDFGFPIFVALWFMWRMEKRLETILERMNSLVAATGAIAKTLDVEER